MDSRKILSCLAVGVVLGVCAVVFSWFGGSENSPLHEFFLHNVTLKNIWMLLNFPAYMALLVVGGRSFAIALVMIFLQWFIIGFVGRFLLQKGRGIS